MELILSKLTLGFFIFLALTLTLATVGLAGYGLGVLLSKWIKLTDKDWITLPLAIITAYVIITICIVIAYEFCHIFTV